MSEAMIKLTGIILVLAIEKTVFTICIKTFGNLLLTGTIMIAFLVLLLIMYSIFDSKDRKIQKAREEEKKAMMTEMRKHPISVAQIKQVIADTIEKDVDQIKKDTDFQKDLGFDSLDYLSMIVEIENETGVEVNEENILSTLNKVIEYLRDNGKTVIE